MRHLAAVLSLLWTASIHAQTPYLVKDINTSYVPSPVSSSPKGFVGVGSWVYFAGTTEATGTELYRTDGTTVELVKDIEAGTAGSSVSAIMPTGGSSFLFSACESVHGCELWISDGTGAGTTMVRDFAPGTASSNATAVARLGSRTFVVAANAGGATATAWVTDGTNAGTDVLPSTWSPAGFSELGGAIYFFSGATLWRSDGTAAGTTVVRNDLTIRGLTVAGGRLLFAGWSAAFGYELWSSDGTSAGTAMLKDINPGAASAFNSNTAVGFGVVGSSAVFFAYEPTAGWSLWRSDGTANGTIALRAMSTSSSFLPPALSTVGAAAYYSNDGVWRTDGTGTGTIRLGTAIEPSQFTAAGTAVYFFARTATDARRLWKTDGTDAGTAALTVDVGPGSSASMTYAGGKIYFSGYDTVAGSEPWLSDGTAGGTRRIANMIDDPPASANPLNLRDSNGRLFFTASAAGAAEMWSSDSTAAGTVVLTDLAGTMSLSELAGSNGQLYFAGVRKSVDELWKSDGTKAGTALFQTRKATSLFASSKYLYFLSRGPGDYYYLSMYRTDGTEDGTIRLAGTFDYSTTADFQEIGDYVYFVTGSPRTLWRTQGTAESTVPLTSVGGYAGIYKGLARAGNSLCFSAYDYTRGTELSCSSLSSVATTPFDLAPGSTSSNPANFASTQRLAFFTASSDKGTELWRSDGTPAGTFLLKDIEPGAPSSSPSQLTPVNEVLFFVATSSLDGKELWKSDGTIAGTTLVADIAPGAASSAPSSLAAADGLLWFAADDGATGSELWVSDGTAGGTRRIADLMPGSAGSSPSSLVASGRRLFFTAATSSGRELWAVDLSASAYAIGHGTVAEGNSGTSILRFVVTRSGDLSLPGTVAFATLDGTATSGADYQSQTGTLSFGAGIATAFVDVVVSGDTVLEGSETFWVTLSAATNGAIVQRQGLGTIQDDDATDTLSVAHVATSSGERIFVVRNDGASAATDVKLRITESPSASSNPPDRCASTGYGSMICAIGTLEAGQTTTIALQRSYYTSLRFDPAYLPGVTTTASLSSSAPDSSPDDNTVSLMTGVNGRLVLPPFLVGGTSAKATWVRPDYFYAGAVSIISSNPAVTITPAFVATPGASVSFSLQVANTTGNSKFSVNGEPYPSQTDAFFIPIVAPGSTPKLDPGIEVLDNGSIKYGATMIRTARVAARRHDGAYPSGKLQLLDEAGAVVLEQSLDATGTTKFELADLKPGTYSQSIRYLGDSSFAAVTAPVPAVTVYPVSTSMDVSGPEVACGNSVRVTVFVRTSATTDAPTGTVSTQTVSAPLAPTGEPGTSSAVLDIPVNSNTWAIYVAYNPTGIFGSSSDYYYVSVGCSPIQVVATGSGASRVALTWTSTGASLYEVLRREGTGSYSSIGYSATNNYLDVRVVANRAYLYRVRATGGLLSAPEVATTFIYEDDPLVPGVTAVKAAHFTQLLTAVNAIRQLSGMSATSFASLPRPGDRITSAPLETLIASLAAARANLALAPLVVPPRDPSAPIRAVHLQALRDQTR